MNVGERCMSPWSGPARYLGEAKIRKTDDRRAFDSVIFLLHWFQHDWNSPGISSPAVCARTDAGEAYARLSVNVAGVVLKPGEFVLHHDIIEAGWFDEILACGVFADTGRRCGYGFCADVPIMRLSDVVWGKLVDTMTDEIKRDAAKAKANGLAYP